MTPLNCGPGQADLSESYQDMATRYSHSTIQVSEAARAVRTRVPTMGMRAMKTTRMMRAMKATRVTRVTRAMRAMRATRETKAASTAALQD